ncbi:hypothetical protein CASFOL_013691 [Castilleja foliolosa]|uniref:Pentatricopeptide repeat-containing protein n=1 Tax=Castilleja foliolosa TaxID=1961234 RepID=A0ABD3DKQ5_9LAMI
MLTLRCARQTRAFLSPFSAATTTTSTSGILLFSNNASPPHPNSSASPSPNSSNPTTAGGFQSDTHNADVVYYFREWFMSRNQKLFDCIFEILRTHEDASADAALSGLNLGLSEGLVLEIFNYDKKDVLSCLKFFDWAGRQPGFHHTRVTFNAIFQIISKAKLMDLMLDYLQNHMKQRYVHKVMYYNILVIGYALAGKCETALQLFGKMRFHNVDLDAFAYNVLMNSLVEEGYFDVVETIAKEIRARGHQNDVTHAIMMKSFCKQNELKRGEEYLRRLMDDNNKKQLSGTAVATLLAALCKNNQFEKAASLIEEFREMDLDLTEHAYSMWIRDLVKVGKLDHALEFLKDKQAVEEYVPDVFRYNLLVCRLLRENRLEEVYDLLTEMKEKEILPDDVTMNMVLCFLCKAGMMDIAMNLYNSRVEFGLSVNSMAYNYLINTLVGDVSVDEAYRVLRNSMEQGYLPGQKTFSIIADALCREGKLDKMKELVLFMLDQNIMPNNFTYDKFISALCRASRVEEGYLLHDLLSRLNKSSQKSTYLNLISGFSKTNRGDIAARLLIEMQEKGYSPGRRLIGEVICGLSKMDNPEKQLLGLLEMQLSRNQLSTSKKLNFFIDGAGRARKPELAMQAYEVMRRNGLVPDIKSDILLLQSHLKSEKIAQALKLFRYLSMKWRKSKLWHTMIIGLCKAKKPEYASQILEDMKINKVTPSIECYEELIKLYCDSGQYHKAVEILNDMTQIGRPVSSFIGNVFLMHALRTKKLYYAWVSSSREQNLTPASWTLGHLIGFFSGCIEENYDDEDMENLIKQCFRIDIYTNNMILRRLSMNGMDLACKYFDRLCEKGYEPNRWTYEIIVHGLAKDGRNEEAKVWEDEMLRKGFGLTEVTQTII